MKKINKKRAFTLVELLIVIVVIGILFIVVVANVDFSTDAAKEAGVQSTFQSYKLAAETAALEYNGFLHDDADLIKYLNKRLDSELQFRINGSGEIVTSNTDPWGTEFRFTKSEPINTLGAITFISAGPDMYFDTNDDIIMEVKYVVANGRGETITTYPEYDEDHIHSYTEEIVHELYKKSSANCDSPALYYYSCSCGAIGSATFTNGDKNPNKHEVIDETFTPLADNKHKLTKTCKSCGVVVEEIEQEHDPSNGETCPHCGATLHEHSFIRQVQSSEFKLYDADCTKPLTYYYSCECGQAGTATFTVGGLGSHNYTNKSNIYLASNATCASAAKYYYTCTGCGAKGSNTYDVGSPATGMHTWSDYMSYQNYSSTHHYATKTCIVCGTDEVISEPHSPTTGTCSKCHNHTHVWTRTQSAAYKKSDANCQTPLTYYTSCSCGEKNLSETFTVGVANPDVHVGNILVQGGNVNVHSIYEECGHTASTTHSYSETIVNSATCTSQGTKELVCECGYGKTETIAKLDHDTNGRDTTYLVSAAYCKGKAVYTKTCSMCHTKQTGTFEYGDFDTNSHKGGETITYVTLNSTHHNKIVKCDTCGSEKSVTPEPHDDNLACTICNNHVHSYTNREVASALKSSANCITPTTYYKSCSCGLNDTEHTFTVGDVDKTIHADGCTIVAVSTSSKCREYKLCHTEVPGGHDYTETVTQAATCLNTGTLLKDCKYCEYYLTETISATGHTPGPAATCTTDQVCTVCGAVLDEANGHTYNQQVANSNYFYTAATCQSGALYYKSCSCGAKGSATFVYGLEDSDNHVNKTPIAGGVELVHSKYACCGATASATHSMTNTGTASECQRCSCGYATSAHNMVDGGTEDIHEQCSMCGYYNDNHVYTDEIEDPTCIDDGWLWKYCDCGYNYLATLYTALGHEYNRTEYDWSDSCDSCYAYKICDRCESSYDGEYAYDIDDYCYVDAENCQSNDLWEHRAYFYNYSMSRCDCSIPGNVGPHNITRYGANMLQHWDYCTLCSYTEDHEDHTVTSWTKTHLGGGTWVISGFCSICDKDLTHYHDENSDEPCPYCNETVEHDWVLMDWSYGSHCMDSGWEYYECDHCGAEYTVYDVNYGDHEGSELLDYEYGENCMESGWELYRCYLCGAEYYEYDCNYGDHDWGWIDSGVGSDCRERDWDYYMCSYCPADKTEYGDYGPHSEYKESETEATCIAKASAIYRCHWCGNERTHEYGSINEENHAIKTARLDGTRDSCFVYECCGASTEHSLQYVDTSTCTSSGESYSYCPLCGYVSGYAWEAARGHDWGNDADGLCEVCNASCSHGPAEIYYRSLGSEGHEEVYFCGECGYEHWSGGSIAHDLISIDGYTFSCSYCGYGVRLPGGGGSTVL